MLNGTPVTLADVIGTTAAGTVTPPIRASDVGIGSERTAAGKRAELAIIRTDVGGAAVVGNLAIYGADLPDPAAFKTVGNAFVTQTAEQVQTFQPDGTVTVFTADALTIPAAVGSLAAKDNVVVETQAFKVTGTLTVTALGAITGSSSDFVGSTAAMVPLLPELDVGDVIAVTGTVGGVAGVTITGTITAVSSSTAATWDQRIAIAATATAINLSVGKRFKMVLASTAAGPRAVNMPTAAAGNPAVTFIVAPPASASASYPGVTIYVVTPTEILAPAAHMSEAIGIRCRSVMWAYFSGIQTAANRTLVVVRHLTE